MRRNAKQLPRETGGREGEGVEYLTARSRRSQSPQSTAPCQGKVQVRLAWNPPFPLPPSSPFSPLLWATTASQFPSNRPQLWWSQIFFFFFAFRIWYVTARKELRPLQTTLTPRAFSLPWRMVNKGKGGSNSLKRSRKKGMLRSLETQYYLTNNFSSTPYFLKLILLKPLL